MITPSAPITGLPVIVLALGTAIGILVIRRALRPRTDLLERTLRRLTVTSKVSSADLELLDRRLEAVTMERLLVGSAGFVLPIAMFAVTSIGGVPLPGPAVILLVLVGTFSGYQIPSWQLRTRAVVARRRFRTSLSAYLDLVAIMLAGGAGIETALFAAAGVGDGPAFRRISDSLDVSRTSRDTPWEALETLGQRIGVNELPELAATVRLGGEQGARMTASLVAKASSLRAKQLAEVEADANAATEKMGLPMVMLFLGFLVLLGYPAMHLINAGFDG